MTHQFQHPSGLPSTWDRSIAKPDFTGVVFRDGEYLQGGELNEAFSIARKREQRIVNRIMRDGDRIEGADIISGVTPGVYTMASGKVFARGDVRPVPTHTFTGVPVVGSVSVGIRVTAQYITEIDDPDLLGLEVGSESEGEKGAAREVETVAWGHSSDGLAGELYPVYLLLNGVPIDQTPPQNLSGMAAQFARYDYGAHGHYVANGCLVTARGADNGNQRFSIEAGEANIMGYKFVRATDLIHSEPEIYDTEEIEAEPRVFSGVGTTILDVYYKPIASVISVVVEKEVTETVTRGPTSGGMDALVNTGITTLVEVKQGATTYIQPSDFLLGQDKVDWSPAGAEPATGSSYTVKYRYLDSVPQGAGGYTNSATQITIVGGVTGGQVILRYTWKLPRVDLICFNKEGFPVYVKGLAASENPVAPPTPTELLALATITNTWSGLPTIGVIDNRSISFLEMSRKFNFMYAQADLLALTRLKQDVDAREPAAKRSSFVDPFKDDQFRDLGVGQSGAVFDGKMQLAIDFTITDLPHPVIMLDYTETVLIQQPYSSACMLINPYSSFSVLPGELYLDPPSDAWTVYSTAWTSPITRQIATGQNGYTTDETVSNITSNLPLLRARPIQFNIKGFAANEILTALTFDAVSVLPVGPLAANAQGQISGTLTIPTNIPAGVKLVRAVGSAGSVAEAHFVGQGKLEVKTMRRVTLVPAPPPQNNAGQDPLAQTFTMTESRFVSAVNLKFCAKGSIGNAVQVQIVKVQNGSPTTEVLAQTIVDMTGVALNVWTKCAFPAPLWLPANVEHAIVVKTDDAQHALSIAKIGDADIASGARIAAQPYTVGVLLASSNATTWTPIQEADLTFQLLVCEFSPLSKSYDFGSIALADCSDFVLRAAVEYPTEEAGFVFEIERPNGEIMTVAPWQWVQLKEFRNEAVKVRAILRGTSKVSPVMYNQTAFAAGKIRTSGTYVTRAWQMGTAVRITNWVKAWLPSGSTMSVEVDDTTGAFVPSTLGTVEAINGGWTERQYNKNPFTASYGRIRITINGGPDARPQLSDFRAWAV